MYIYCSFSVYMVLTTDLLKSGKKPPTNPEQKITVRQGTKGLTQQCHAEHQDSPLSSLSSQVCSTFRQRIWEHGAEPRCGAQTILLPTQAQQLGRG